jgi:hypothetical protein
MLLTLVIPVGAIGFLKVSTIIFKTSCISAALPKASSMLFSCSDVRDAE